jgi:tetratricopeptide (TPR) repeat protein
MFGGLYPAYARGEAYLEAQRGREAAAEFQKVLDHRGVVFADPICALAHLQLGRAYALSVDKNKAKAAYKDFLTLWKEADSDIPILKQAKRSTRNCNERTHELRCGLTADSFTRLGGDLRVLDVLFECLVEEEHEVLQKAELSGALIQRTTSEAPQRLCITSDWLCTRKQSVSA